MAQGLIDVMSIKPSMSAPPRFWRQLEEGKEKVRKGELTEDQLRNWYWFKMDYYGGIKEAERWWLSDSDRGIDIRPSYESGLSDRPKEGEKKIYG